MGALVRLGMLGKLRTWMGHRPRRRLAGFVAAIAGVVWTAHPKNGKEILDSLSRGETVAMLTALLGHVWHFVSSPFLGLYLLAAGFVLIVWSRKDPDPTAEPSPTPEQRLDKVDGRLKDIDEKVVPELRESLAENDANSRKWSTSLATGTQQVRSLLEPRIAALETAVLDAKTVTKQMAADWAEDKRDLKQSMSAQGAWLDRVKPDIRLGDLEVGIGRLRDAVKELPKQLLQLAEMDELVEGAGEAIDLFIDIRELYPNSDVAERPFSAWWPHARNQSPLPPAHRDALVWTLGLQRHMTRSTQFHIRNSPHIPADELVTRVSTWKVAQSELSGDLVLRLLRDHFKELTALRESYAARVTVPL